MWKTNRGEFYGDCGESNDNNLVAFIGFADEWKGLDISNVEEVWLYL